MSLDLDPVVGGSRALTTQLEHLDQAATDLEQHELSERTQQLYQRDWDHFAGWCANSGLTPLPAAVDTIRFYLADMARLTTPADGGWAYKPSTVGRRLAAIAWMHKKTGHASPTADHRVAALMKGMRRERQQRVRRMRPLLTDDIRSILGTFSFHTWPHGAIARRDALAILLGYAGARRRSEVAALRIGDIDLDRDDGLHVLIRKSKTDQTGQGVRLVLPFGQDVLTCAPCWYVRWLRVLAYSDDRPVMMKALRREGPPHRWEHVCDEPVPELGEWGSSILLPIMRKGAVIERVPMSGEALHHMLRRRAAAAGYSGQYGYHSLRAGFVTQARRSGADSRSIRLQTSHTSDRVLDVYDREYVPGRGSAVHELGL